MSPESRAGRSAGLLNDKLLCVINARGSLHTDDIRIVLEERAAMSPDALTGMEANHRFVGPETMESKIFARLTAWQNWIFNRPNAVGPEGALRMFGTGRKAVFDRKRV